MWHDPRGFGFQSLGPACTQGRNAMTLSSYRPPSRLGGRNHGGATQLCHEDTIRCCVSMPGEPGYGCV